jgi:20S proteasome alpha/beta subunit
MTTIVGIKTNEGVVLGSDSYNSRIQYSADMNIEQAIQLSNKAIEKALGERPLVETGIVTAKDGSW